MEEHSVTHQNKTRCNSILLVISKKSPLPNTSPQGFQENSLFPGKTLSHTHTHKHTHTQTTVSSPSSPFLCLSPLTLHLILHSSPSLCLSLSTLCLVFPSFTLSFSSSVPPSTSLLSVSGKACLINDTRHRVRSEGWVSDK